MTIPIKIGNKYVPERGAIAKLNMMLGDSGVAIAARYDNAEQEKLSKYVQEKHYEALKALSAVEQSATLPTSATYNAAFIESRPVSDEYVSLVRQLEEENKALKTELKYTKW